MRLMFMWLSGFSMGIGVGLLIYGWRLRALSQRIIKMLRED